MGITPQEHAAIIARQKTDPQTLQAKARRILAGGQARNAGDAFEALIMNSTRDRFGSIAELVRIPPSGCKWIKRGGHVLPIPLHSPYDFTGSFPSGVGLHFDAKAVSPDSPHTAAYLGNKDHFPRHQLYHLQRLAKFGACAGLLFWCGPMQDIRWLPGTRFGSAPFKPVKWHDTRWIVLVKLGAAAGYSTCFLRELEARWGGK